MENNKSLSISKNNENNETLNYSLSSIHLHVNNNEFEKDKTFDAFIKDKEHLHIEYNFVKKLGEGTFGVVVLAIHKKTNEKVAIKILEKQKIIDQIDMNRIKKEIHILKQLRHNNIVDLYNVIETASYIYLIMEYIDGIELFEYIINNKRINEIESCHFYQQIISGIEYLEKLNIAHRDIKPENLIIDKNKRIKIIDFGLSNNYKTNQLLSTACGSPFYAAPEMVKGNKYNGNKIDIWSSGIVLYAMLCGFLPFDDKDIDILYRKIMDGIFEIPAFLSEEAINLINHILEVDPNKRYNINEIKKHPWYNIVNPKINMTEGLLLNKFVIPYDEKVISYMSSKFTININDIKYDILLNLLNLRKFFF
jgi:5'-AMP-activated protein kinase catalytic alpha subunit